jgi:hypothetical protein
MIHRPSSISPGCCNPGLDTGDNLITIPRWLRAAAVRSNGAVSASIQYLDFADETGFVNAATQLISTLTAPYPFTAVLVDSQSAQEHLAHTLGEAGIYTGRSHEAPVEPPSPAGRFSAFVKQAPGDLEHTMRQWVGMHQPQWYPLNRNAVKPPIRKAAMSADP